MMNGNNTNETNINQEIITNQILLLKEKIQNLQNIHLNKKLKFQKESFERIKQEKQLDSNNEELKTKNNQITQSILNNKDEIQSLKDRNHQIKLQSEEMGRKITEFETRNNKLLEEINNKTEFLNSLRGSSQNIIEHLLSFNKDTLNSILIKLYNINNEKNMQYMMMLSQKNFINPYAFQNMNYNMQNNPLNMNAHVQPGGNVINNPVNQYYTGEAAIPMIYGFPQHVSYNIPEYYYQNTEDQRTNDPEN